MGVSLMPSLVFGSASGVTVGMGVGTGVGGETSCVGVGGRGGFFDDGGVGARDRDEDCEGQ